MVYSKKPDQTQNPPDYELLKRKYAMAWGLSHMIDITRARERYDLTHDLLMLFQHGRISQAELSRWLVGIYEVNSVSSINAVLAMSPAFLEEVKNKTIALIKRQLKENP